MSYQHIDGVQDVEQTVDQLSGQAELFAQGALAHGMLTRQQAELISSIDQHRPEQLFGSQEHRPLVVAFFGGTGVGKSTLLNRFAGETVARTGIERPTSREVTIYVHRSVELNQLPKDFPVDKVNIRQHQDQTRRAILWIDMPDIDSVEASNLEIVRDWLPYIDVLLYVVSPERYRDDRGWQFVIDEGYKHAWIFVINQWNLGGGGDNSVMRDFDSLLQSAGFDQPLLYRTDCMSEGREDDFDKLSQTLLEIANEHTINELDRRGIWNRLQVLQDVLRQQIDALGKRERFDQFEEIYTQNWTQVISDVQQHLELPVQKMSAKYTRPAFTVMDWLNPGQKSYDSDQDLTEIHFQSLNIWDSRVRKIVEVVLDKITLAADNLGIPVRPFQDRIVPIRQLIDDTMESSLQKGLRQGLAKPGNKLQRMAHQFSGLLTTILPLAALSWVAYRVISVYYDESDRDYLGADFAIHSFLLVLVAWLIPYVIYKKSRPSIQKAVKRGLETGIHEGLHELDAKIRSMLDQIRQLQNGLLTTGEELLAASSTIRPVVETLSDTILLRMLQKKLHTADSTPRI